MTFPWLLIRFHEMDCVTQPHLRQMAGRETHLQASSKKNRWPLRKLVKTTNSGGQRFLYKVSKVSLFINHWLETNQIKIWNSMTFPWPEHIFLNSMTFPGLECKFQIPWLSMTVWTLTEFTFKCFYKAKQRITATIFKHESGSQLEQKSKSVWR